MIFIFLFTYFAVDTLISRAQRYQTTFNMTADSLVQWCAQVLSADFDDTDSALVGPLLAKPHPPRCHGGPGYVAVALYGWEIYQSQTYADSLANVAQAIWARGTLTKGLALGHGASGNSALLLIAYQRTVCVCVCVDGKGRRVALHGSLLVFV